MAKFSGKKPPAKPCSSDGEITVNGKKYRQINIAKLMYIASAHCDKYIESLDDCGANGGIAGEGAKIINKNEWQVDVQGIDNHQNEDIPIVTAGAVITIQHMVKS